MNKQEKIIELAKAMGIIRPRDLKAIGIPDIYLLRLVKRDVLIKIGRGMYSLPDRISNESQQLSEISVRIPNAVICLLSALQFHSLTTQAPGETWIALKSPGWKPKIDYPPIRVVWFSGDAFDFGVEEHRIENIPVKIYNPSKTIADCFKYRNKIGLEVALEALRAVLKERKANMDQLWQAAKVCRVSKVMKPYLEATV